MQSFCCDGEEKPSQIECCFADRNVKLREGSSAEINSKCDKNHNAQNSKRHQKVEIEIIDWNYLTWLKSKL